MAVAVPRARPRTSAKPEVSPALPGSRGRQRERALRRPRLTRWVVWIAIVGVLLAGIVALNVTVLRLRMESGNLQSENIRLRADNAAIQAQLSTAAAVGRVEAIARGRLGLVRATGTRYLKVAHSDG